jgi:hypothetical protein
MIFRNPKSCWCILLALLPLLPRLSGHGSAVMGGLKGQKNVAVFHKYPDKRSYISTFFSRSLKANAARICTQSHLSGFRCKGTTGTPRVGWGGSSYHTNLASLHGWHLPHASSTDEQQRHAYGSSQLSDASKWPQKEHCSQKVWIWAMVM